MSLSRENLLKLTFVEKTVPIKGLGPLVELAMYKCPGLSWSEIVSRASRDTWAFEAFTFVRTSASKHIITGPQIGIEGYPLAFWSTESIANHPQHAGRQMLDTLCRETKYDWRLKRQVETTLWADLEYARAVDLLQELAGAEFARLHALRNHSDPQLRNINNDYRDDTYRSVFAVNQPVKYDYNEGIVSIVYPKPLDALSIADPVHNRENEAWLAYMKVMTKSALPLRRVLAHLIH